MKLRLPAILLFFLINFNLLADYGIGPIIGSRSVVAVMLQTAGTPLVCSRENIEQMLSGDTTYSLRNFYARASYGNIAFDNIALYGIYTISSTCEDWGALSIEANAALLNDGVDINQFDHIIYFTNQLPGCRSSGSVNSPAPAKVALYKNSSDECSGPLLHEVGHGLGFNHSGVVGYDYGDDSDVMGARTISKYMTAAHAVEASWIPEDNIKSILTDGIYRISAVEVDPQQARHPQVLRIATSDPNYDIFLSYRVRRGFTLAGGHSVKRIARKYMRKTNVHLIKYSQKPGFPNPRISSDFLGAASENKKFTDDIFKIRVKQISHNKSVARVNITLLD